MLWKFRPVLLFTLNLPRILPIISRKSWYSMQTKSWWWAIWKICMYLILLKSRKFYAREIYMLYSRLYETSPRHYTCAKHCYCFVCSIVSEKNSSCKIHFVDVDSISVTLPTLCFYWWCGLSFLYLSKCKVNQWIYIALCYKSPLSLKCSDTACV